MSKKNTLTILIAIAVIAIAGTIWVVKFGGSRQAVKPLKVGDRSIQLLVNDHEVMQTLTCPLKNVNGNSSGVKSGNVIMKVLPGEQPENYIVKLSINNEWLPDIAVDLSEPVRELASGKDWSLLLVNWDDSVFQ